LLKPENDKRSGNPRKFPTLASFYEHTAAVRRIALIRAMLAYIMRASI
jgi:hypothetical protein